MEKTITKHDWKIQLMPNKNISINFDRQFSQEEFAKIKLGFLPRDMDDRWFSYTEKNIISFHRSWTGNCIYQAFCEETNLKTFRIYKLVVNQDREQYQRSNIEEDKELFNFLIDNLLLDRNKCI